MVHRQKTQRQNMKKINKKRLEPEGSAQMIFSEKQTIKQKRTIS